VTRKGRERGGRPFTKNSLYRLLTNIIYIGKVDYQGTVYEGEHPPIIDAEMWQRVQATLRRNGQTGGKDVRNKYGALLKGLIYCEPCGTAMIHTYTVKNSKRYRYYVCLNAQQRGWHKCPTKSINAHTIETAVVEQVRGMGRRGEIMEATVAQAREQGEKRLAELATERSLSERELKRLYAQLRKLVDNAAEATTRAAVDQMGSIQERIAILEDRMNAIRQELLCLQREAVDERDLARALAVFDPVWDSLAPREQARIIRLLIERVGYDGRDGRVTVTFRAPGIKSLCQGTDPEIKEVVA
jgi:site-specific DNA recombinase